ncbi:Rv3654c family TadE-like protein [Kineococcus sp. SYSU DK004]|uniref:Rv3654c family TadE-like protein n=1 Tax=Kineococcus sp. SYSU DK004 TaxID=3383125 RepID=UPI003D7C8BFE
MLRVPAPPRSAGGPDRGSGTVLVLALGCVALTALLLVLALGGAVLARHRAASAADLAALAAADVLLGRAGGVPCERAGRVVAAHGAAAPGAAVPAFVECAPAADGSVLVRVAVPVTGPLGALGPARAAARAGAAAPPAGSAQGTGG